MPKLILLLAAVAIPLLAGGAANAQSTSGTSDADGFCMSNPWNSIFTWCAGSWLYFRIQRIISSTSSVFQVQNPSPASAAAGPSATAAASAAARSRPGDVSTASLGVQRPRLPNASRPLIGTISSAPNKRG